MIRYFGDCGKSNDISYMFLAMQSLQDVLVQTRLYFCLSQNFCAMLSADMSKQTNFKNED